MILRCYCPNCHWENRAVTIETAPLICPECHHDGCIIEDIDRDHYQSDIERIRHPHREHESAK